MSPRNDVFQQICPRGNQGKKCRACRTGGTVMSSIMPLLAALVVAFCCFAGTAHSQAGDEAVRSIENHYRELGTLRARVVQKNFLKSFGKTKTFSGALSIKKPGRLRLDYTNGQRIVIDGKKVWFYSRKNEQVIKRTFTDFEEANIPVAFLLGAASIRDDFTVVQPKGNTPLLLDLVPKRPGAPMKKIRLRSEEDGRIVEMRIFDRSGNVTTIAFTEIQEGVKLRDELFRFSVPKGTEIIEQ